MQITENIHALKVPFQVKISPTVIADRFVYIYIICGEKIWLIDTGVSGSKKIIFDYIESIGRNPKEIESVFLTHCHPDHIGSAKSIKEECKCSIFIHSSEKSWTEDVNLQYQERPVPGFNLLVDGSVIVEHTIEDKDIIKLDKTLSLEIFHTPGHSTGSISYFLDKDKALFCGDAILSSGQMPIFEDLQNCKNSIKKLVSINKIDILLSSWDVPHKDVQIFDIMQDSLKYLTEIDRAIKEVAIKQKQLDSMEFCKQVIDKLSLPNVMLNPLVARSFQLALNKNRIKL
jgi:glyoxylase-like metal-dependent hydrolase (beta-lactamase superfamily II)